MISAILLSYLNIQNAVARDTWTNIATGIDYLHRVESDSTPQDIFAYIVREHLSSCSIDDIRELLSGVFCILELEMTCQMSSGT